MHPCTFIQINSLRTEDVVCFTDYKAPLFWLLHNEALLLICHVEKFLKMTEVVSLCV